jgi:protein-L-isoaspartate(D-aspartate) O-methyltransferase
MLLEVTALASILFEQTGRPGLDARVVRAMRKIPRHEFVPVELKLYAYLNRPLPIGYGKTISQPFIVALMTNLLQLSDDDVVLEIGTGLGYQAAILAQLAKQVYTVECIAELAEAASRRLAHLDCDNVEIRVGNGFQGWSEHAPYDKMIVTAAPDLIPPPLLQQLKAGGRMVIPTGIPDSQKLLLVEKSPEGRITTEEILPVLFAPLEMDDEGYLS